MGPKVTLDSDVVKMQLGALENLLTELDQHFGPMQGARQRQGSATWTAIGAAQAFGSRYGVAIDELETTLRSIREEISAAMVTLRANATDLANRDQENRDRFAVLAKRLSDGVPSPTIGFQSSIANIFGARAADAVAPEAAAAAETSVATSTESGSESWK